MTKSVGQSFPLLMCNLRWLALGGQALTIVLVTGPLGFPLPQTPLWSALVLLAVFNVYVIWDRRRRADPPPGLVFAHMLVDITELAWVIAWSGGIENPFSSLFLMPLSLAVLVLPTRWLWATALACLLGYGASVLFGRPLPHVHQASDDVFTLHKFGMFVNFAVSAIVLLIFVARLAAAVRAKDREMAELREQFTRNEGIVALATHAASVAHELNTPLATLTLMVEELEASGGTTQQREDYATLRKLLEVCRDRVRELSAPANRDGAEGAASRVDLEQVIERWRLVRPTIELRRTGSIAGRESVEPAVGHLLQVLLNNAADAGERVGNPVVELRLEIVEGRLNGDIRDYGAGLSEAEPLLPAKLFRTRKPDGLGVGLALSHATVERLGGELSMQAPETGPGVRVSFRLPEVHAA